MPEKAMHIVVVYASPKIEIQRQQKRDVQNSPCVNARGVSHMFYLKSPRLRLLCGEKTD